ncbi:MAG TPA: TRAP transporter small permease [Microvirga sp.]|jgi:TRAP-type C4-dicarboxylate transport system permease small subunit|nr:TRAP transporter small permease [Microvirga sp.]
MSPPNPPEAETLSAPQRVARLIERAVAGLSRAALVLAGLTTLAIFGLVTASVVTRYFFNRPQPWIDEAVGWLLVMSVMLALPEVQRRGDHIGIDWLATRLSAPGRRLLLLFGLATVLISGAIFVVEGIEMVEFSRMIGVLSNQIPEVPLWAVQALIPAGFALLLLVAGTQFLCAMLGLRPRDMAETAHEEPA